MCALLKCVPVLCLSGLKRESTLKCGSGDIKLVSWARCVNTAIYYTARVPESGVRESDDEASELLE